MSFELVFFFFKFQVMTQFIFSFSLSNFTKCIPWKVLFLAFIFLLETALEQNIGFAW